MLSFHLQHIFWFQCQKRTILSPSIYFVVAMSDKICLWWHWHKCTSWFSPHTLSATVVNVKFYLQTKLLSKRFTLFVAWVNIFWYWRNAKVEVFWIWICDSARRHFSSWFVSMLCGWHFLFFHVQHKYLPNIYDFYTKPPLLTPPIFHKQHERIICINSSNCRYLLSDGSQ